MNNNSVLWLVENWAKEQSFLELEQEIKNQGYPLIKITDFKTSDLKDINNQCVVFNGSIQMARMVRGILQKQGCFPIIFNNEQHYDCSRYYPFFLEHLFNDKYTLVHLKALKLQRFFFWGTFGIDSFIFIRPNSGDKTFQAQLLDFVDFDSFYQQNCEFANELVLVSTPKNIKGEYRFICSADKEIIAHSTYRYQGLVTKIPFVPPGAKKKCEEILKIDYKPDLVFTVDIAEDNDGNFWLLELNSFSSSGLYACDKQKIVKRVSEIAMNSNNQMM